MFPEMLKAANCQPARLALSAFQAIPLSHPSSPRCRPIKMLTRLILLQSSNLNARNYVTMAKAWHGAEMPVEYLTVEKPNEVVKGVVDALGGR